MKRDIFLILILSVTAMVLSVQAFAGLPSPDLAALWAAAAAWMDGAGPAVYASTEGPFDTIAAPALRPAFDAFDYDSLRLAYIYAPLWLAVTGPLTEVLTFESFLWAATVLNTAMMLGIVLLTWCTMAPRMNGPLFLILGVAALMSGQVGGLALYQNQVQIAVVFLILLAANRTEAQAPITAGAVLALAAALKAYPVLLVVVWIGRGDWRALASFAVTGAALGIASVLLTGWPIHVAFLEQLGQVSATAMVGPSSFSLPSLWSQLTAFDALELVKYPEASFSGLYVGLHDAGMRALMPAALLAVLAAILWQARLCDPLIWASGAGAISLMVSVSWSFHFLGVVAALPVLIDRLGPLRGGSIAALLAAAISYPAAPIWRQTLDLPAPLQLTGTLTMLAAVLILAASARRRAGNGPAIGEKLP